MKKNKKQKNKKRIDIKWIICITIAAFIISLIFSMISETIIPNVNLIISIMLLFVVIFLGIVFDMIGLSVTVADLKTFNGMAARKVKGAQLGVKFIKNAEKLSSFCNDVIGDICGIISGSIGVNISVSLANQLNISLLGVTLITTALIASITIGGKAIGKTIAINKCNEILFIFCKALYPFIKNVK